MGEDLATDLERERDNGARLKLNLGCPLLRLRVLVMNIQE